MIARYAVMVAVMLPLASGFSAAGDKKDGTDQLQGEWVVVSVELAGKKLEGGKERKLVVKGDEWTAPSGGKFKFKIDATKSPKQLDLSSDKSGQERTWPGIYKIEGDTLTFCRSHGPGGERPVEFKGGPGVFLMVCKRAGK
jgi:uncharacterized protein (TIGR03067 family)